MFHIRFRTATFDSSRVLEEVYETGTQVYESLGRLLKPSLTSVSKRLRLERCFLGELARFKPFTGRLQVTIGGEYVFRAETLFLRFTIGPGIVVLPIGQVFFCLPFSQLSGESLYYLPQLFELLFVLVLEILGYLFRVLINELFRHGIYGFRNQVRA